jgi:cyclopropane fatty-acyl-phospholipid synthase-like methyltransferase
MRSDASSAWEDRSATYGASLKSVLFKGMPTVANEHFHKCHLRFILESLNDAAEDMSIFDVGCGYGRLSAPLIEKFPKANIIGMDMSPTYAHLYHEITGREAFSGTLETIPSGKGPFDCIICVTVLMYLERKAVSQSISRLLNLLKPEGKLIIIEPHASGLPFQTGCGLFAPHRRQRGDKTIHTGGDCFTSGEINTIVASAGGTMLQEQRIPATTFFFLPIYVIGNILPARLASRIFRGIAFVDGLFRHMPLPSLWTFLVVQRNRIDPYEQKGAFVV